MNDNIVAISTAMGVGAISIIRLSGKDVISIVNQIFKGKDLEKVNSHTINYGYIVNNDEIIDEVLVTIMKKPKTYTMEDIVEINCHGGIATTNKIMELILTKNVRLAYPGEFTKRAFLNGRIDLTKAEAVMDLINSDTESSRQVAISSLQGNTFNLINNFRNKLKDLISSIEVNIDYPEYYDIEVMTLEKIKKQVTKMKEDLSNIIKESQNTKLLKYGIDTLIIGKPNVGKSSILNKLLQEEKAIVTDIEGTTRDIVEGNIIINNVAFNIIDTAGIRKTEDKIEKIGVEKSISLIDQADLVIVVLDGSKDLSNEDLEILNQTKDKPTIVVINKNDLDQKLDKTKLSNYTLIETNTFDECGINPLKEKMIELFQLDKIESKDYQYLTNTRQISLAKKAYQKLENVSEAISNNMFIDLLEIDLKECFDILGEIIGNTYTDEIIDHLFENFCVGK